MTIFSKESLEGDVSYSRSPSSFQSWLCGKFVSFFSPETVALVESHGYESPFSKYLMRWTAMGMEWICELLGNESLLA